MRPRVHTTLFGGRVLGYAFAPVEDDGSSLVAVEFDEVPITAVRTFVVAAPTGTVRGGHGHRHGSQLLVRLSGEIVLELAMGDETARLVLDEHHNAALVRSPVWSRQTYCGDAPQLMVLSDTAYDPASYVYDHPSQP